MWIKRALPQPLLILACLIVSAVAANAQDRPKGELFVGFSGRTNGDPILKGWNASAAIHINEQLAIVADFSGHYGSFPGPGAITFSTLTSFLQGNPYQWISRPPDNPLHVYSFLAGPQFSHKLNGRARFFVRGLFGATRISGSQAGPSYYFIGGLVLPTPGTSSQGGTGPSPQSLSSLNCQSRTGAVGVSPAIQPYLALYPLRAGCPADSQTGFSFDAGGGLDVTVAKHWAVRVFQADYLNKPNVLGQGSNDFRLSSGLLYQW